MSRVLAAAVLAGVLALAGLAGCGQDGAPAAGDGAGRTRTVTHASGTSEVPAEPQRVLAVTGTIELESLLALGVTPIAAAGDDDDLGGTRWLGHLEDRLEGVTRLPSRRNPNLERVAARRPDLIVGLDSWAGESYRQLSGIAPTVLVDGDQPWEGVLRDVAAALGREDEAEELIAAHERRVADLAERHPGLEGTSVTLAKSFVGDGQIELGNGQESFRILRRLGFRRPPAQARLLAGETTAISLEQMRIIDTDAILLFRYEGEEEQRAIDALREHPLFSRLRAVGDERVFEVNSEVWHLTGPIGAELVVDDLERRILPALTEGAR